MPRPIECRHRLWRPLPEPSRLKVAFWIASPCVLLALTVSLQTFVPHVDRFDMHGRAELDLAKVEQAVNAYRAMHPNGRLPEPSEFPGILCQSGPRGEPPPFDPDRLDAGRFLDPWGHDYEYIKLSATSFRVVSYGRTVCLAAAARTPTYQRGRRGSRSGRASRGHSHSANARVTSPRIPGSRALF